MNIIIFMNKIILIKDKNNKTRNTEQKRLMHNRSTYCNNYNNIIICT